MRTLFSQTRRESPGDTEVAGHRLLLRAGFVRQLGAGLFSYLPLAQRSLRRIETILREEMDRIGGQEITMPVVNPASVWQATGTLAEDRRGDGAPAGPGGARSGPGDDP